MTETIYVNKKTNKDLKRVEVEMNKMMNKMFTKMNNLFNDQFNVIVNQISTIETQIDRINEKLWPNYFYLEAINNATITVNGLGTGELKYTKTPDDESSWTTETISSGSTFNITLDAGEKCYFFGDITTSGYGSVTFVTTDPITCGGNVYYVADKNGILSKNDQCHSMFNGCTGLTVAPALPATTLTEASYSSMFNGCTGLTTTPELPATTLATRCYRSLFEDCTGLTSAPELPATTLATECYREMFSSCTGLTSAPLLPATTLAKGCYRSMFNSCLGLTSAPLLPATTLAEVCYSRMFDSCTQLNYVKCLATDMTATGCTTNWLRSVASTGTFVKDANTTWSTGVDGIPSGWTIEDE